MAHFGKRTKIVIFGNNATLLSSIGKSMH